MRHPFIVSFWIVIVYTLIALMGCASEPEPEAVVEGQISGEQAEENANSSSAIDVTIIHQDSAIGTADTLYHEITDSSGSFSGRARVPATDEYRVFFSREGERLAQSDIILSERDTVEITAELPDIASTLNFSSKEYEAMNVFERVDNGFRRIARFAQLGGISEDSLAIEIDKWSDLYWDVYENNPGTLAGQYAAGESIRLLNTLDGAEMMRRLRLIQDDEELVDLATIYGKEYLARNKGLDHSLAYLDTLQEITESEGQSMRIQMERIKILYDSARSDEAMQRLSDFKQQYEDHDNARSWAESIEYDLNYLAPGDTIPMFSFQDNGRVISRDSMLGTPYILEITTLANSLYQEQYDRSVVIHSIYKNFNLEFITIPLDQSQITVDAFFDERMRPWPVASAGDFDREELMEEFNVSRFPTRFLVDKEGRIVRKFVGEEYQDVIASIKSLITQEEEEPPS